MMYRPKIQRPKIKPVEKQLNSYVFDSASEMNKVAEIVSDLERLKNKFKNSIDYFTKLAEEIRKETNNKLDKISDNFIKNALFSIKNDTQEIIQNYQNKILEIDIEIERIKTIQKGDKGDNGKNGIDGVSPDINLIIKNVLKLVPFPKDGKDGKDAFVDEKSLIETIIKKLLEKGLEIKNIKNLEETLRHLSSKTMLGGAIKGGGGSWHQKSLSGTINGINTVFTFSGVKPSEFSEQVYLNYISQNPFTDYAINYETQTITYTVAPDNSLDGLPHIIRYHA